MKLVIIEGPGKRDTLKKYLGNEYDVFATKGHVRDLPAKSIAIDINHNFEPKYEIMPDKRDVIKTLLEKAGDGSCHVHADVVEEVFSFGFKGVVHTDCE